MLNYQRVACTLVSSLWGTSKGAKTLHQKCCRPWRSAGKGGRHRLLEYPRKKFDKCHPVPIGSMYDIYGNIYHQYTPNVSIYIYIPYMDPMGLSSKDIQSLAGDYRKIPEVLRRRRLQRRWERWRLLTDLDPMSKLAPKSSSWDMSRIYFKQIQSVCQYECLCPTVGMQNCRRLR